MDLGTVANQINDTLHQINVSTQETDATATAIKGNTDDIKTRLDGIKASVENGFLLLANGLFAIHEAQKQANALLEDNVEQNQTIICWLKTEADLLCRILRRLDTQIDIQTETRDAVVKQAKVLELVHARETLEIDRTDQLHAEMLKCCPPPKQPPEHCYDGCDEPRLVRYEPKGQDWAPPGNTIPQKPPG
jgi:hypothetical protein